ncbi:choice-of-anchor D domain-containing protein [Agarilytica rhodophyticola]|uniref:choice-of-anchor D domain-containing protein n=1 Tax=Agarilytica rhodophyticola TaxID=1737490 RepID=UPI001319C844|nr:choice-of-anchor D domain-containing protein [Agarilytica rhodophyticola]
MLSPQISSRVASNSDSDNNFDTIDVEGAVIPDPEPMPLPLIDPELISISISDAVDNTVDPNNTQRLSELVDGLEETTAAQQVKKVVLELAMERANYAVEAGHEQAATEMYLDVANAIYQSAIDFTHPNPEASHLSGFGKLRSPNNNPYLDDMVHGAERALANEDVEFGRVTLDDPVIDSSRSHYSRTVASLSRRYFWLFAHSQSPMRHNPELIKRALRRMHTFADLITINYYEPVSEHNQWRDQFAYEYAFSAFYEIAELYPGLLLPSQKRTWDNMMQLVRPRGGVNSWRAPWNYNIETAFMVGNLNIGLYLNDHSIVDRILTRIDRVIRMQRPDGAMPYHGDDRPSVNYHNVVSSQWMQIYEQTGYQPLREALEKSQWKGPTTGRTEEWWSSPFDKAFRWNIQKGVEAGTESVASLSQNPYVRGQLDRNRELTGGVSGRPNGIDAAVWYDPAIPSLPLPENYTIPDRNIGGARSWYGDFTHSGSFRPWKEGYTTLVGAMTVDPGDGQLNSILAEVTPKVLITAEDEGDNHRFARLTDKEVTASTISRDYSISTAVHGLKQSRGAYAGPRSDWNSRQLWLGLPDRMLGLVSTTPRVENPKGRAVQGVLRLISGGSTGAKVLKKLEKVSSSHYRYGQLDIIIHDHNYSSISGVLLPYRVSKFPATELTFSDRDSEPVAPENTGSEKTYPSNVEYRFVVEVRPTWVEDEFTQIDVLGDRQLLGLQVEGRTRSFQIWLNADENDRTVNITRNQLPSGRDSFVISDGLFGRPEFHTSVPRQAELAPGQHAFVIISDRSADHDNGWASFSDLVGHPDMQVTGDVNFGHVTLGSAEQRTFTITNVNQTPLQLSGSPLIEIDGDSAFSVVDNVSQTTLVGGDNTTFTVRFAPSSDKKHRATVRIRNNTTNSSYEMFLQGEGGNVVELVGNSPFGTSWNNPDIWEDGQAARAGKVYAVSRLTRGGSILRTPTNDKPIFPGDYLKIIDGGTLLLKAKDNAEFDIKRTIFDGGSLVFGSGARTYLWKGGVWVEDDGMTISGSGVLNFTGSLIGSGPIYAFGIEVHFASGDWNGFLQVGRSTTASFGFDIIDGEKLSVSSQGTFDLNGRSHQFRHVIVDGVALAPGTYTARDLGEGFSGSGRISVGFN